MTNSGDHQSTTAAASAAGDGIAVIIVPFPAQGHLNQMLQLACLIASYGGATVHYAAAAVAAVKFHDLPTPPFPSPPPNPAAPSKFPCQLQPAWDASLSLRRPMAEFIRATAAVHRRAVVIHDSLIAVLVQDAAAVPNAETYAFNCLSAFCQAKMNFELAGKPFPRRGLKELPAVTDCISGDLAAFIGLQEEALRRRSGDIYNTSRLIEPFYMDLLDRDAEEEEQSHCRRRRKNWAIGPIIPADLHTAAQNFSGRRHECLSWLDKQEPKSVIYVTFGTTTSLSDEEISELAAGLERSGHKFIWVLRDADKANIFDGADVRRTLLPAGYEERLSGRAIVVRDWAPQPEILAHRSTGGFMTHCGWNSCLESLTRGVPMAAWPMHSDQPANALMVTEVLGAGFLVREYTAEAAVVRAPTVEAAVRRLMESEEGRAARKRAEEWAEKLRRATEDGGASRRELEAFLAHIYRPGEAAPGGAAAGAPGPAWCEVSANGGV
ncbi:zeatin O-xylosyltransferase-like [Andrographis paniculata]|uniref:zeatin O-xylosyltransferase-like n=1 Tax=Andrographis paniculata TaxID=175694 RepID=UPI0021E97693|nr:zeatin O-xylosyltransferase-like [Andrographis paniculata]